MHEKIYYTVIITLTCGLLAILTAFVCTCLNRRIREYNATDINRDEVYTLEGRYHTIDDDQLLSEEAIANIRNDSQVVDSFQEENYNTETDGQQNNEENSLNNDYEMVEWKDTNLRNCPGDVQPKIYFEPINESEKEKNTCDLDIISDLGAYNIRTRINAPRLCSAYEDYLCPYKTLREKPPKARNYDKLHDYDIEFDQAECRLMTPRPKSY